MRTFVLGKKIFKALTKGESTAKNNEELEKAFESATILADNVVLQSSTSGSTKTFKLKVVDAGTLTAEEIV